MKQHRTFCKIPTFMHKNQRWRWKIAFVRILAPNLIQQPTFLLFGFIIKNNSVFSIRRENVGKNFEKFQQSCLKYVFKSSVDKNYYCCLASENVPPQLSSTYRRVRRGETSNDLNYLCVWTRIALGLFRIFPRRAPVVYAVKNYKGEQTLYGGRKALHPQFSMVGLKCC